MCEVKGVNAGVIQGLNNASVEDWDNVKIVGGDEIVESVGVSLELSHALQILTQAGSEMKDRATTYDNDAGERSIGKTVKAFAAVCGGSEVDTEEKGWLFMLILKLVRSQQGEFKLDNYVDATAYASLMGEAATDERGVQDEV